MCVMDSLALQRHLQLVLDRFVPTPRVMLWEGTLFPRLYAVGCGSVCPRMWLDLIQIVDQNVQQRSLECSIDF